MKVTGLNTFNFFLVITVTGMAPPALTNELPFKNQFKRVGQRYRSAESR